jgi:transposase
MACSGWSLLLRQSQDYQLLRPIRGIGPINALMIIAEASDLRPFGHHRQFLKFCGLDLSTGQSSQYRGRTRLSKFGDAGLRRTLWIGRQVAVRQRENGLPHKFRTLHCHGSRQSRSRRRPSFSCRRKAI